MREVTVVTASGGLALNGTGGATAPEERLCCGGVQRQRHGGGDCRHRREDRENGHAIGIGIWV